MLPRFPIHAPSAIPPRIWSTNDINYNDPFCIAQISNFNKLIAISNETSTPIFDIQLKNPTEGQLRTLGWFKKLYGAMAERIIELTDEE